jgi:hypothetical protein
VSNAQWRRAARHWRVGRKVSVLKLVIPACAGMTNGSQAR